ncbi:MAG: hypothetical protein KO254_11020 [Methanoculleus marisnigri]|nr:hypothetical protein [Methanoculleus marisnigri]
MLNRSNMLKAVLVAGVILAALLFIFMALVMGSLDRSAAESFQSSYRYELKVSTSGPLRMRSSCFLFPPDTTRTQGRT